MSDHPSAADSMAVHLGLQRCNEAPGCPCASMLSSPAPSSSASSSRSCTATPSGHNSVHSASNSGHSASDSDHNSGHHSGQENSESAVPDVHPVQEWSGLSVVRVGKCHHERRAVLKKCTRGVHSGSRYLGCLPEDETKQCQFVEWLDEPWPERVQKCLKGLWHELQVTRRCEATANETVIEVLKVREVVVAATARANLQATLERTRRVAHQISGHYYRKATSAEKENHKLMVLIYCLLAVIALLVVAVFNMAK